MVSGGAKLIKYLLFFFNLIFVLTGLAVIIVGGVIEWKARHYFDFVGRGFTSTAVLLIIVGVVIFLIAFLGCCGAYKENHCMVRTFSVMLFIIFILELSAGIAAYVYQSKLQQVITDGMKENLKMYNTSNDVRKTWDDLQKELKCCGANNSTDYETIAHVAIPDSCKSDNASAVFEKGCAQSFFDDFTKYQSTIGGVGIGIAFVQIVGIVLACFLAHSIKKQYEVV